MSAAVTIDPVSPPESAPSATTPLAAGWWAGAIALVLLAFYLSFGALVYDGDALKHAGSFWGRPSIGASNHPFVDVWFGGWWQLVKGWAPVDFVGRMAWLEALNALLGAGAVGFAVGFLRRLGLDGPRCALGGLILGLSTPWMYHSLQTTEPIMGQFWLMASLWAAVRRPGSIVGAGLLSGACWALSVVAYQTYFLAGPAVLWMAAQRRETGFAWVGAAGLVGIGLFTTAAVLSGAHDPAGVFGYLTTKHDGEYWGFFRFSQAARVPVGLVQAVAVPWPTEIWPGLLAGFGMLSGLQKVLLVVQSLLILGFAGWALFAAVPEGLRRVRGALLIGFAAGLFPPFYLSPLYNKMWIYPISFLLLLAVLASIRNRRGIWILGGILAVQLAANVPRVALRCHNPNSPGIKAAVALRADLGPDDLLICDGWDESGTFGAMYPNQPRVQLMFLLGGAPALEKKIEEAQAAGRRVFVFGLVERTTAMWAVTDLGTRHGLISFAELQSVRDRARIRWRGRDKGCHGDLFELPAAGTGISARP